MQWLKKLSNYNKDAIKSSLLVGVAYAAIVGGILKVGGSQHPYLVAAIFFFIGVVIGLFTTWDFGFEGDDDTNSNA